MCGIAGLLSTQLKQDVMERSLSAMQQALRHRGPDDKGHFLSPSKRAALTHTRLAIIDLSDTGAQPMTIHSGRYTITFNGEIYNYRSLRKQLVETGVSFYGQSDTEVVVQLYAKLGANCVSKLRGMFAFVIWDEQEQTAFAARDPFGIKPFYFWQDQNSLAFASELRAVLASGLSRRLLSKSGLQRYFETGTVTEPHSIIDDITMLPAGHYMQWNAGQIETSRYWEPLFKDRKITSEPAMSREDAIELARKALQDSVRAHLVSDVPVGIFLSGGIDSTALVALATQISETPIATYSIAFEDAQWNEGDIAQRVANHFGTQHTEFMMTATRAKPLFKRYLATIDQPTIDGFNTFCVSHLASEQGQKVVLSGIGGDELFAGYKSFKLLPKMLRLGNMLAFLAPFSRCACKVLSRIFTPRGRRVADFLSQPRSLAAAYQSLRGVFSNSESAELTRRYKTAGYVQSHNCDQIAEHEQNQQSATSAQQSLAEWVLADQVSQLELTKYMRNQLLRDSDTTSMSSGLELRVPFVDQVLFDALAMIPARWRLEFGKKLLIDSVPEIPSWVTSRHKQGFRFPFDEWFSEQWSDRPSIDVQLPNWLALRPWYRRWSIVVLNDWIERYAECANSDRASL